MCHRCENVWEGVGRREKVLEGARARLEERDSMAKHCHLERRTHANRSAAEDRHAQRPVYGIARRRVRRAQLTVALEAGLEALEAAELRVREVIACGVEMAEDLHRTAEAVVNVRRREVDAVVVKVQPHQIAIRGVVHRPTERLDELVHARNVRAHLELSAGQEGAKEVAQRALWGARPGERARVANLRRRGERGHQV